MGAAGTGHVQLLLMLRPSLVNVDSTGEVFVLLLLCQLRITSIMKAFYGPFTRIAAPNHVMVLMILELQL